MLGHKTPRDMLIARLAIARKREAAMRQLHAIDAEAKPYDEAIVEMLEEGRDVHLEYMDPVDKRFRKFTVRRTSWGEVEFSRAESVRDLRFPIAVATSSPPVADAVADSPSDDDDPTVKADVETMVEPFRQMVEGGGLNTAADRESEEVVGDVLRNLDAAFKAEAARKMADRGRYTFCPCCLGDHDAVLDPRGNLTVEIEREDRRSREAIIRDGIAAIPPELDPVAGLGSLLRETRCGEPRIPTIRDGKSVAGLNALTVDLPDTLGLEDILDDDDETADSGSHAVVETQAVS